MSQYHYHITPNLKCTNPSCTYPKYNLSNLFLVISWYIRNFSELRVHEPFENFISISLIPYFLVFEAWGMYICSGDLVLIIFYSFLFYIVTWYIMRYIIWLYFWHFVISCISDVGSFPREWHLGEWNPFFPGTRNRRLAQITTLRGIYTINVNGEMPNWKNAKTTNSRFTKKGGDSNSREYIVNTNILTLLEPRPEIPTINYSIHQSF